MFKVTAELEFHDVFNSASCLKQMTNIESQVLTRLLLVVTKNKGFQPVRS